MATLNRGTCNATGASRQRQAWSGNSFLAGLPCTNGPTLPFSGEAVKINQPARKGSVPVSLLGGQPAPLPAVLAFARMAAGIWPGPTRSARVLRAFAWLYLMLTAMAPGSFFRGNRPFGWPGRSSLPPGVRTPVDLALAIGPGTTSTPPRGSASHLGLATIALAPLVADPGLVPVDAYPGLTDALLARQSRVAVELPPGTSFRPYLFLGRQPRTCNPSQNNPVLLLGPSDCLPCRQVLDLPQPASHIGCGTVACCIVGNGQVARNAITGSVGALLAPRDSVMLTGSLPAILLATDGTASDSAMSIRDLLVTGSACSTIRAMRARKSGST